MGPLEDKSPFVTSGMRLGTPAVTTRGLKEDDMSKSVDLIDRVLMHHQDEEAISSIKSEVNSWMSEIPLFKG